MKPKKSATCCRSIFFCSKAISLQLNPSFDNFGVIGAPPQQQALRLLASGNWIAERRDGLRCWIQPYHGSDSLVLWLPPHGGAAQPGREPALRRGAGSGVPARDGRQLGEFISLGKLLHLVRALLLALDQGGSAGRAAELHTWSAGSEAADGVRALPVAAQVLPLPVRGAVQSVRVRREAGGATAVRDVRGASSAAPQLALNHSVNLIN